MEYNARGSQRPIPQGPPFMNLLRWSSVVLLLAAAAPAWALGPADVFVVVNKNVPESQEVADHYCTKRGVPKENVVVLDLPAGEDISRADYNTRLVAPLREALKDRRDKIKVILTVYGVPLRVGAQPPSDDDRAALAKLQPQIDAMQRRLRTAPDELACLEHQRQLA